MRGGQFGRPGVVIAGASVAGLNAADELRAAGYTGSIIVLSDEASSPYDRPPLSKAYLESANYPIPALRDPGHFEKNDIEIRLGHGAAGLDVDRRYLITTDGDVLPWEHVIIATGSSPKPMVTETGYQIPLFRTIDDATRVRQAAATYHSVTLIGAGFISLEIASALRRCGVEVTVIGSGAVPLAAALGERVGASIRDLHLRNGVKFRMDSTVESITGDEGDLTVHLADGSTHHAEYVVSGAGTRPNTGWLQDANVDLAPDTGAVIVDGSGRTSVAGVWAAGDVATRRRPDGTLGRPNGHWTVARQQAKLVAGNVVRATVKELEEVPYFWTDQYDRKIQCYGRLRPDDDLVVVDGSLEDDDYLVLYGNAATNQFHGVVSNGRDSMLRPFRKLLKARGTWSQALDLASVQTL